MTTTQAHPRILRAPAVVTGPDRATRLRRRRIVLPVVAALVLLALWELTVLVFDLPRYLLPSPVDVAEEFITNGSSLLMPTLITAIESYLGFLVAGVLGIAIGITLSRWLSLELATYPYLVLIQTIPSVAIAPLLVVWLGAGIVTNAMVAVLCSIVPIAVNTLLGLKSTDHNLVELYGLAGASRLTQMFSLRVPSALPQILTGLRIASGAAVIGAIVGEFAAGLGGGQAGLGWVITQNATQLRTTRVFAAIIMASLISVVLFAVISLVERRVLSAWHDSARAHDS